MPDRIVYSTDSGRVSTCPRCGQPFKKCRCDEAPGSAPARKSDGFIRIMRDRKQRGGKTVTVISGLPEERMSELAQQLKKLCGSGGTIKDGNVEVQGDHIEKIEGKLIALGYKVKRVGG